MNLVSACGFDPTQRTTVASIPMPGERSLRPVKNRENVFGGVSQKQKREFWSTVLTKLFPFFHWASYTLNKKPEGGRGLEAKREGNLKLKLGENLRPILTPGLAKIETTGARNERDKVRNKLTDVADATDKT